MRVLVTGAGGFVGRHLVKHLSERGHYVAAGSRGQGHSQEQGQVQARAQENGQALEQGQPQEQALAFGKRQGPQGQGDVQRVSMDIMSSEDIRKVLLEIEPDAVIHLAAQSNVGVSWDKPLQTMLTNTIAPLRLLEEIKSIRPGAKLISIGSSEEYGATPHAGEPLTETSHCLPQNPYAISKFAAGQLLLQQAKKDGLNVVHVRPFNHTGPGQSIGFVVADFASQIAKIERGELAPVIRVGNLAAKRDFTDVRDIVRVYSSLMESEVETGIYNASSKVPREIGEILHTLIGYSSARITVEVDPGKFRPVDTPVYIGSSDKLKQAVGWSPQWSFEQSLLETLDWWRERA